MKTIKRAFCMLLVLILTFSGVVDPSVFGITASAENVETKGSENVGEKPKDILTLGGWQYYVEDGLAIIAGYTGNESALSIPDKFSKYPVAGIGEKAFSANGSLASIYIPTNVTRIASNAFEGLNGVTIKAYNGSFALRYAEKHKNNTQLIGLAGIEFADGVIDLTGVPTSEYYNLTDYGATFKATSATFLEAGQVIYFPVNALYKTGLIRKVISVAQSGSELTAVFSEPEWGESFKKIYGSDELIPNWDNAIFFDGFERVASTSDKVNVDASFEPINLNYSINSKWKVSGKINIDLGRATADYSTGEKSILGIKYPTLTATVSLPITYDIADVGITYKNGTDAGNNGEGRLVNRRTMCKVPVGSAGGVITGYFTFDLVLEFSGSVSVSTKVEVTYTVGIKNNLPFTGKKERVLSPLVPKIQGELKGGPEASVYFVLGWGKLSFRFLEISLGAFLKAGASIRYVPVPASSNLKKGGSTVKCSEVKTSLDIELSGKIGVIKIFEKDLAFLKKWKLYQEATLSIELFPSKFHFDDDELVEECRLENRDVIIEDGEKCIKTTAIVNGFVPKQPNPSKDKHTFNGWYVDAKRSNLVGSNYAFDFNNDRMPYCGPYDTLYICAEFKKILPDSVKLDNTNITAYSSDSPVQLKASVFPKNAYNTSIGWTSSDESVAKVDKNGKVSFAGRGTATIKATARGNTKLYAICNVTVKQYVTKIDVTGALPYMAIGENQQLSAAVSPSSANDKTLNWSSSNTSVATVDSNGNVTAKGAGTAQITATAADGGGAKGTYTVYVMAHPVTGITLNRTESTEYTNNHAGVQFIATVAPSNADVPGVTWSSSDSSIATVDANGIVHFVAPGTAVITCTSVSRPKIKAQSIFHVRQYAEQIDVDSEDFYAIVGHSSKLIETVYPANTSDKRVSWSSSNPELAEIDANGYVTSKGYGDVYFTATAMDGSGVQGTYMMRAVDYEPVMVSSIVLDTNNLVGYTDEKDGHQFTATVYPNDADYKAVKWTSDNPAVASIDANGKLSFNRPGTATITCCSVSTKKIFTQCKVTVKQHIERLEITGLQQPVNPGDIFKLGVNVFPSNATDKNVTWTSSKPEVASIDPDGTLHCLTDGFAEITVTANDGSGVSVKTGRFSVGQPVKIPVESVSLDITSYEIYTNQIDGFECTPTVLPEDAYDMNVQWSSSDMTVATVDAYGQIRPISPGNAVITCRSVDNPNAYATCSVTVKQYVENIFVDYSNSRMLADETQQMTALVYPDFATEKGTTWSSSDPSILTVSESGLVKALKPGTATITATANDGGGAKGSAAIIVEKQLQLENNIVNNTVFTQGDENCVLSSITLSTPSMLRMAKAGYEPEWSLTKQSDNSDAELGVITSALDAEGISAETSIAVLTGSTFPTAGTEEYTVTCKAGPYTDSVDITVNIDGGSYAKGVKLSEAEIGSNSFNTPVNESSIIPAQPFSTDEYPLPQNMDMSINGDYYFKKYVQQDNTDSGDNVSFDKSGIYTANVHYSKANLGYDVTGTWYVADENDIVHLRVEDINLSDSYISIVESESYTANAEVYPEEAYDRSITWESKDPTIATVTSEGVITGVKPGTTSIICSTNDGSEISTMLIVNVQDYLQLDENELEFTAYTGGKDHVSLDTINVTSESEARLVSDGRNVTWSIEKLSGDAVELGLNEYKPDRESGLSVNGNQIMLLRVNGEGRDKYRITCTSDGYTASCTVTINAVTGNLPETIMLNETDYSCAVNDYITLNTQYSLSPETAELPEGTVIKVDGGRAFNDALSPLYSYGEPEKLIFEKPGMYTANVMFYGTNYSYTCPVKINVADEEGNVPAAITDIVLNEDMLSMFAGDTVTLTADVIPQEANHSPINWSSTNTSVATVSDSGEVTAIGRGYAMIVASAPESDYDGSCLVYVEDGLTMWESEIERTVFVDGATRMTLETLLLTDNSSMHLEEAPEWSLRRISGISLTLQAEPYETVNDEGQTLYGCELKLYSVSKEGDTVYELTCSSGEDRVSIPITVHAVYRDRVLPASIEFDRNRFEADIDELISVTPVITAYPADTTLPKGIRLTCEGDRQFTAALNAEDCYISQSLSTFSFKKAGTYNANFIYSYSNVKYVIPVTFGIRGENGEIPVQASKLSLSSKALYLTKGETSKLEAVFTPVDATNQNVTWQSTDPTVASVDAEGNITAKKLGITKIFCIPEDTECPIVNCAVTVEDPLSVDTGNSEALLYIQGKVENTIVAVRLSVGTGNRLNRLGLSPEWTLEKDGVTVAEIECEKVQDGNGINIRTTALNKAGKDTYTIRCSSGEYEWSRDYTIEVVDLGDSAPQSVTIAQPQVSTSVGEVITVDFTPVVNPENAIIPDAMVDYGFIGIGEFYDALDWSVYLEDENSVTLAFTKPGQYILTRQLVHRNLSYLTQCVISVGNVQELNVLDVTETEYTVYTGGRSGVISTVSLNDAMIGELWGGEIAWSAERISGDSVVVSLRNNGSSADVFAANVLHNGTDVWRIKCSFGGVSEYVDIRITAADPRGAIPESISLGKNTYNGMIGNWIAVPIGVSCAPAGSMLPDQGDEFWSFELDRAGEERSSHSIMDGMLNIYFTVSGYYTGTLKYRSGNVSYSVPVYFIIRDEEEEVAVPQLNMYLINSFDTVYPEGETGVSIGQAVMAETLSTYSTGASVAYMKNADALWEISTQGSCAEISLSKVSDNVYDVILSGISTPGDMSYTVSCTVNGETVRQTHAQLHVASDDEPRPEPTLTHTRYTAIVGEPVTIDKRVVSSQGGTVLKSVGKVEYSGILSAVGYEVKETDDKCTMTFYQPGIFNADINAYISNIKVSSPVKISVTAAQEPVLKTALVLPKALKVIEPGAFTGITAEVVDMSGTKVTTIGEGAFASCINLSDVYLPDTVTFIADNAFYGCLNIQFHCVEDSYAAGWATEHGLSVIK